MFIANWVDTECPFSLTVPLLVTFCISVLHLLQFMKGYWCISINWAHSLLFVLYSYFYGFWQTHNDLYYGIKQNSFLALKILFHLFIPPYSPAPTSFPFPEYHIVSSFKFSAANSVSFLFIFMELIHKQIYRCPMLRYKILTLHIPKCHFPQGWVSSFLDECWHSTNPHLPHLKTP